jgi:SNF2 family DNA or RNA helicase
MEIIDNKALVLRTRDPGKYNMIPKSSVLGEVSEGLYEVAVHWGLDEARVLKNLGVRDVPSPILRNYSWPINPMFIPFVHQKTTASFFTLHNRCFCFNDPGTGKTMSALWAADYLMSIGKIRRCLVLCPLSIMTSAWMGDIGNSIVHRSAVVCHHSKAERRREMVSKNYDFVIANYDGLPLISPAILEDGQFDLIIVDEGNAYKTVTTRRWKALNKLVLPNVNLWLMTGTPAAQSPEDAYGLAKLVSPSRVPKFFTGWRDSVMYKVTRFKWAPKPEAYDMVYEALQPAIRFTKDECLDLPAVLTEVRDVPLTAQQVKYYKQLKERMVMQAAGETVTAVNAAAGVNKLLQVCAGAAYTDNHEVVEFDCKPRLDALLEVLTETKRKVLIFAMFRHSMDTIAKFLDDNGITNAQINGDVSPHKRTEIFSKFQESAITEREVPDLHTRNTLIEIKCSDPNGIRALIIQPQAAQHGVTLTAADTVVFWGPVASVETYIQCVARMDRQGQNSGKVTVIHLQGGEIERRMFKRLAGKVENHNLLMNIYAEELENQ